MLISIVTYSSTYPAITLRKRHILLHNFLLPPKGSKGETPTKELANGSQVGCDAQNLLAPSSRKSSSLNFIENEHGADRRSFLPEELKECRITGDL